MLTPVTADIVADGYILTNFSFGQPVFGKELSVDSLQICLRYQTPLIPGSRTLVQRVLKNHGLILFSALRTFRIQAHYLFMFACNRRSGEQPVHILRRLGRWSKHDTRVIKGLMEETISHLHVFTLGLGAPVGYLRCQDVVVPETFHLRLQPLVTNSRNEGTVFYI